MNRLTCSCDLSIDRFHHHILYYFHPWEHPAVHPYLYVHADLRVRHKGQREEDHHVPEKMVVDHRYEGEENGEPKFRERLGRWRKKSPRSEYEFRDSI